MYNKSVSPVVATALLLVVAVVAIVGFQGWIQTYSSQTFTKAEEQGTLAAVNLMGIQGGTLYFQNNHERNITVKSVRVNGNDCQIRQNVSEGIEQFSLSNCIENQSGAVEVMVETTEGVQSQEVYLEPTAENTISYQWCYQEAANESDAADGSCNLQYDGSIRFSQNWSNDKWNILDGDNTTGSRYNSSYSLPAYLYINYSIPSGATNESEIHVVSECGTCIPAEQKYVRKVPQSCLKQGPLQLRHGNIFQIYYGYSTVSCYNGSSWEQVQASRGLYIYEEAMRWQVPE